MSDRPRHVKCHATLDVPEVRRVIEDAELGPFLEAILARYHYDFRAYSVASMRRRLSEALPKLGAINLGQLHERLVAQPQLFSGLLGHLTVPVTEMFRDPSFYRALREQVAPVLATYPSIKVWVAGCSSGEEAYSVAIVLAEAGLLERSLIYATDINPAALEAAAQGAYELDRFAGWARDYVASGGQRSLSDYSTAAYGRAVMTRSLKQRIVFSDHSLATDSVFSEVHLVTCRNVLIYFQRALQERSLGLFREALVRRGFLGLGARETLRFSDHAGAFEAIDAHARLYRKL